VSVSDPLLYGGFALVVAALLAVDLFVVHRESHAVSIREAATWSAIWVGVSILFGLFIPVLHEGAGPDARVEFFTGYVIEKSLSVDNVFLFVLVFGALSVPRQLQHRVLFYGVAGAIAMRTVLVFTGAALIERFEWILYLFGAFLLYAAWKTWTQRDEHPDIEDSRLLARVRRVFPTTDGYRGDHFWVREGGRLLFTPMFIVLVLVALYFLLAGVADKLRYLKAGLAIILGFVGLKLLAEAVEGIWHPDPLQSLAFITAVLVVVTVASLRNPPAEGEEVPFGISGIFGDGHRQQAPRGEDADA
jgi:tellurite resistance protein TerC